jgi:hypothetical protein
LSTKPKKSGDETIETIDDITRKNAVPIPLANDATPTAEQERDMLKPSLRFLIVPIGAVATLASLSSQHIAPRAQRDGIVPVREQVVDCSVKPSTEVCVISSGSSGR